MKIRYKELRGWKYQVAEEFSVQTGIRPDSHIEMDFASLTEDGILTIRRGYAWDGASGPAIDTPDFIPGSCVHDTLYQMMALGFLPKDRRRAADDLLVRICKEDGMPAWRRAYVWAAVRAAGGAFMAWNPERFPVVLEAP